MNQSKLQTQVFAPVVARVRQKRDSLKYLQFNSHSGFEGWLKVEIIAALGKSVRLQNRGPDIVLENGTLIELKATTDFKPPKFLDGLRDQKSAHACLFLGKYDSKGLKRLRKEAPENGQKLFECPPFKSGEHRWAMGLLIRSSRPTKA